MDGRRLSSFGRGWVTVCACVCAILGRCQFAAAWLFLRWRLVVIGLWSLSVLHSLSVRWAYGAVRWVVGWGLSGLVTSNVRGCASITVLG